VKDCIFCQIIADRLPSYRVYEDDSTLAFLDHRPLLPGHVLLVPKVHYQTFGDLPPEQVGPLFLAAQQLARAVENGLAADGSFVAINIKISQSVPHLHLHIVPRRKGDGLFGRNFQWMRRPYPNEAAIVETQRAIQAALGARPKTPSEP
jgi:histidine triad (HIT) family protein